MDNEKMRSFIKNYNMYEIPDTKNCFKVEVKQENKKPMFLCVYKVVIKNQYQDNIEMKSKKLHDKDEALQFVLDRYNEYINNL